MKSILVAARLRRTAFGNFDDESQRDSGSKPGVARDELPRVAADPAFNPNGVAPRCLRRVTTPLGLLTCGRLTQGSSFLATLGWTAQSLWDCRSQSLLTSAATMAVVLVLAGCGQKAVETTVAETTVLLGPQFSAKQGLLVPEDTRRSLGLKFAEVTEQKVRATIEVQLRVYQAGDHASLASGTVTPEQAKLLKPGQSFQILAGNGSSSSGKVTALNDQLQKATGMIEVLAEIPSASAGPAVGKFLQADIALDSNESVVSIPRAALLQSSDGYSVYTVSGEHLVRTPVKVGASNSDLVEIKDGLYAGDQVVLQPVMSLWMTELAAVKGGQACCAVPAKGK